MVKKQANRFVARYYTLMLLPFLLAAPLMYFLSYLTENSWILSGGRILLLALCFVVARYLLRNFSLSECLIKDLNLPLYEELLRRFNYLKEPSATYGVLMYYKGNYRGAMQIYQALLTDPELTGEDYCTTLLNMCLIWHAVGNREELEKLCDRLEAAPQEGRADAIPPRIALRLQYFRSLLAGDREACLVCLDKLKALSPDREKRLYLLGDQHSRMLLAAACKDWEEAVPLAKELIAAFPDSGYAMTAAHVIEAAQRGCSYEETFSEELPGEEISFSAEASRKKKGHKIFTLLFYVLLLLLTIVTSSILLYRADNENYKEILAAPAAELYGECTPVEHIFLESDTMHLYRTDTELAVADSYCYEGDTTVYLHHLASMPLSDFDSRQDALPRVSFVTIVSKTTFVMTFYPEKKDVPPEEELLGSFRLDGEDYYYTVTEQ